MIHNHLGWKIRYGGPWLWLTPKYQRKRRVVLFKRNKKERNWLFGKLFFLLACLLTPERELQKGEKLREERRGQ